MITSVCALEDYENLELYLKSFGLSKAKIKKFISRKELNKKIIKKSQINLPINLINVNAISPVFEGRSPKVISINDDFICLSKPYDIHIHPLSYLEKDNLLSWMRSKSKFLEVLNTNSENYDRGALFRLDYGTSGVVVFARKDEVYEEIRKNFNKLFKQKTYLAIVSGKYQRKGVLESYLLSSGVKGKKVKSFGHEVQYSKRAHLEIMNSIYNESNNLTLLMISLKEGLRHQIRAQLSAVGFPILGDQLYGGKKAERIFLHAAMYELEYKNNKKIFRDFNAFLFNNFFDSDSILNMLNN